MKKKLRTDIAQAKARLKKLQAQHHALPARVSVAQAQKGEAVVRLSKERKHLTNVLKIAAYQIESDLLELIRPHYKRVEDEGRTLIHTFLQDAADIEPTAHELRIQFAPLSSQHRTRVLEALCATLNQTSTVFPGTELKNLGCSSFLKSKADSYPLYYVRRSEIRGNDPCPCRTPRVSPLKVPSLQQLRRYMIARSLFKPTSLLRAIARLGFVQADPIRAPARAQDLILAHRVKDYRVGELERRYPRLAIEEAFFINYGFLPRETLSLLHPRGAPRAWDAWDAKMQARAQEVLAFVCQHGPTYPKDVQAHFDHGRIRRWGADLNVSNHLLEGLHYRGLLRVARREGGTRVYQTVEHPPRNDSPEARLVRAGHLLDMVVQLYAPLPAASLVYVCRLLSYGVPHLAAEVRQLQEHAKSRYTHAQVDGLLWFWPQGENPGAVRHQVDDRLRFLAPFDPVVWDRRRFQLFWSWEYKLEAYVPAHKRRLGHYAMPMLWGEQMLGWANLKVVDGRLQHELGFAGLRPRGSAFRRALDEALQQMQKFLEL